MKASDLLKSLKSKKLDITALSDASSPCVVTDWMSTGCVALDAILGGGLPVGRMIEIYGDNSTGKSLIAAQVVAMAQQDNNPCLYIDTENAVSLDIMAAVGVDVDELMYCVPDTVESVFTIMQETIEAKRRETDSDKTNLIIVWDSVAATSVESEMANDYGKATMGKHAQLISQSLRKIIRIFASDRVCALFLNQTREKIGIMFGDSTTTFGGHAIPFHASIRVALKHGGKIKEGKKVLGIETRATVVKNKVAVPFLTASLPIYFGHGINDELASFYYMKDAELMTGAGSYYEIPELKIDKFKRSEWSKIYDAHYNKITEMILNTQITEDSEDDVDESTEED